MRSITRDLLGTASISSASASAAAREEQILTGVQSFQVSFYDGANWQTSWQFAGLNTNTSGTSATSGTSSAGSTAASSITTVQTGLPSAIRIDIQQAPATPRDSPPPRLEVLVPWTTQPFAAATPATSTGTAATPTPTPAQTPTPAPQPPTEPPSPGAGGRPPR